MYVFKFDLAMSTTLAWSYTPRCLTSIRRGKTKDSWEIILGPAACSVVCSSPYSSHNCPQLVSRIPNVLFATLGISKPLLHTIGSWDIFLLTKHRVIYLTTEETFLWSVSDGARLKFQVLRLHLDGCICRSNARSPHCLFDAAQDHGADPSSFTEQRAEGYVTAFSSMFLRFILPTTIASWM